jgi:Zn-dependent protease with chaperone function
MAMTREQYEGRIAQLERIARERPGAYKARVAAFALLGYGYLALIVLALLAALAGSLLSVIYLKAMGLKLVVVVAPVVWLVLRSLVVHISPPTGIAVTRKEAPALFERIERLRKAIGAPRFHRVVVNEDFNASVAQVPRLGLFGWHRNHLVLGLPLLRSLHPQQLDAVLAHELGHLAGGHARFSNWLYRLRMIWSQLQEGFHHAGRRGNGMFARFLDWYVPRFNAYSFPLARANEYEADAASARLTSPQVAAEALTAASVVGSYLQERFWPGLHAKADDSPQPAFAPYSQFGSEFATAIAGEDAAAAVKRALAQPTSVDNTHPALADRLCALGATPRLALPQADEAAWHLLGAARENIAERLDRRWQDQVSHDWRKRHDQVQLARARLTELEEASRTRELDADAAIERARLEQLHGSGIDASIAQLRTLLERASDNAVAHYQLGAWLLERNDGEEGQASIKRAIELDIAAAAPGYAALRDFHWRRGEEAAAHDWHRKAVAASEEDEGAREERARLLVTDRLQPAELDTRALAALGAELAHVGGLRDAWIARKRLAIRPQPPLYVLGFRLRRAWWRRRDTLREAAARNAIVKQVSLPGETFIVCVDAPAARRIGVALGEIDGAAIPLH